MTQNSLREQLHDRLTHLANLEAERRRAEEALRESEQRLRALIANSWDGLCLIDADGLIRYSSPGTNRILGYPPEEMVGSSAFDLVHPDEVDYLKGLFERLLRTPTARISAQYRCRRKDGDWRWIEGTGTNLLGEPAVRAVVVNYHDITERKRAQEKLQQYAARLRTLSHRLMETQEAERRHLARELHDEIGQLLTGLKLSLDATARARGDGAARALDEARALVHELAARVRDLSLRLRPTMLDDLGLLPALLWHFERYTAQTGVHVALRHAGLERRFAPGVETAAYRIVQEALTNVARHAGVMEVAVGLWADPAVLVIRIEDRGDGFATDGGRGPGPTSGLAGMRERAVLLGGGLSIESRPGLGTCLTAELPLGGRGRGTGDADELDDHRAGG
jgi:PAS domain S-box-containing protein